MFAVPGPVDSRMSRGCHALIKDGAKLVETIDDVLAELGPLAENIGATTARCSRGRPSWSLNEIEQQVLAAIDDFADIDRRGGRHLRPADSPRAVDDQRAGNAPAGAASKRHAGVRARTT